MIEQNALTLVIKVKGKGSSLDTAPLTVLTVALYDLGSGSLLALASGKWLPIARANGLLGPQYASSRHTTPQSTTLSLHPIIRVPNYMDHYSFTDPRGMDG